ncbi:hypothetical protein HCN44_003987 [Aphidius gifuensis]|uniref:PPM-type phosphatase domain-containing protein n=1 Tax=Aphidius gifuensis TaxID=684658 RepID=A0A834XW33_APHGI|nr:protein phosphatase 1L [Aphidius gifuensis]KAF7994515.1 hypothetical protein HCN44_003987 [Aphidius gifuensis]
MDDELEDKVLYQTYMSYMKLLSKFAVGLPTSLTAGANTPLGYFWRIMRIYALRPEILVCCTILFFIIFYLNAVDIWSRSLFEKINYTLGKTSSKVSKLQFLVGNSGTNSQKQNWELKQKYVAAFAIQGHRAHMEDRFVINDDISGTGVSLFAVFDGHGGQFAADYAKNLLIPSISKKITTLTNMLNGISPIKIDNNNNLTINNIKDVKLNNDDVKKKLSFRKTVSQTDDNMKNMGITDPELLKKLDSLPRPITREVRPSKPGDNFNYNIDMSLYFDGKKINYSKILNDEVLAADRLLVEAAKKNMDVAGTTALIAIVENNKLIVANVGDSRGVMCDNKGNAIPLSFDHKPQQQRERQRINKAGGLVTFNGVWRVAGILATSRALGDYPLKDKKLVIADPDILTFDLTDHDPMFIILATDGLWDTFTNEEAVAFVKERLHEPFYGAKSLTLQSYYRGSLDNITVLVVNLKNRKNNIS